jgi:hypothetical protein
MACAPAVQNRKHPSTSWQHIVRMVPTGTGRVYVVSRHFPDTSLGAVVARHRKECEFAVLLLREAEALGERRSWPRLVAACLA